MKRCLLVQVLVIVLVLAWGSACTGPGDAVPPGDEPALAHALEHLVEHPSSRKEYGVAARRKVLAQYTWKRTAERTVEVYQAARDYFADA